jgi:hypothetical protein
MTAEQELTQMEQEVGQAITSRDLTTLDRLIADDFINTNPFGVVMTKQEAPPPSPRRTTAWSP